MPRGVSVAWKYLGRTITSYAASAARSSASSCWSASVVKTATSRSSTACECVCVEERECVRVWALAAEGGPQKDALCWAGNGAERRGRAAPLRRTSADGEGTTGAWQAWEGAGWLGWQEGSAGALACAAARNLAASGVAPGVGAEMMKGLAASSAAKRRGHGEWGMGGQGLVWGMFWGWGRDACKGRRTREEASSPLPSSSF
jgi:hypothetical protein